MALNKDHERETGFYWVQLTETGPLQVAEWSKIFDDEGHWYLTGEGMWVISSDLFWIDEGHRLEEPRDRTP